MTSDAWPAPPYNVKTPTRALNTQLLRQETFLDDITPVDNSQMMEKEADGTRLSHEFSLGSIARASVVDNMLMSFSQLPNGSASYPHPSTLYPDSDDQDLYTADSRYASRRPSRSHGDTYASSRSSDLDLHTDEFANFSGLHSSRHSRGRTDSGSALHTGMDRAGCKGGAEYNSARTNSEPQARATIEEPSSAVHTGRGLNKASKGSNASSVDLGHIQAPANVRVEGLVARSASFDHGYGERVPLGPPIRTLSNAMMDRGRPQPRPYNFHEAAPTPVVSVGPWRSQEPVTSLPPQPAQPLYAPPQVPAPNSTNGLRPPTSKTVRIGKPETVDGSIRDQASEFVSASINRDLPPLPARGDAPARGPATGPPRAYASSPPPQGTPKERPGFFRRVFGSSRGHVPPQHDSAAAPLKRASTDASLLESSNPQQVRADQPHMASRLKSLPRPPTHAPAAPREEQHAPAPTLGKKSSFFRRRKKSASDSARAPLTLPQVNSAKLSNIVPAQPSPSISSLRRVMSPYLSELATPTGTHFDPGLQQTQADDESEAELVSGSAPAHAPRMGHMDATDRPSKPEVWGTSTNTSAASSHGEAPGNADSPRLRVKMRRARASPVKAHDDTFLTDSSGNEDRRGSGDCGVAIPGRKGTTAELPVVNLVSSSFAQSPLREQENATPRQTPKQRRANTSEKRTELLSLRPEPRPLPESGKTSPLSELDDDGWIVTTPTKQASPLCDLPPRKSSRVWLEPSSSEEKLDETNFLSLPIEGARLARKPSTPSDQHSPTSSTDIFPTATSLPAVSIESGGINQYAAVVDHPPPTPVVEENPTTEDREKAFKIFNGEEDLISKAGAASWLGGSSAESTRTRRAYMELFDWTGFNILLALRDLCSRLVMKAESQQLDRLIDGFSCRWCECNPNHGFKADDVVHSICYAVFLLNTDLHRADIEQKMTRNQFVKNTLPIICRIVADAAPGFVEEANRVQSTNSRGATIWDEPDSPYSPTFPPEVSNERHSLEIKRSRNRLSVRGFPIRADSDSQVPTLDLAPTDNCNVLVKAPFEGTTKAWEFQVEIILKEFYNSIRQQPLPLHGAQQTQSQDQTSGNALTVMTNSMLRRTPSVLSKAPSETLSYRGRSNDHRSVTSRWGSKGRTRPRLYPASTVGSSRTSFDDQSVWSPAGSSSWSRYSYNKTQTSMSMESLGSHFSRNDYQKSIGFANALSNVIIREENASIVASSQDCGRIAALLDDETLELSGAPWAKEGILKHKHHLESVDKKAKDRNWNECFAVIERGWLRLFSFSSKSTLRLKSKTRAPAMGGAVGGGNWMESAEPLGSFLLRHTIASMMPPPGYSKSRPHVWALSLPTGAVHLFQVGTPDIVSEFVTTANYWSARLSKEPLVGGVSNIEYGWGEGIIHPALLRNDSAPNGVMLSKQSFQGSTQSNMRGSLDHGSSVRARLPGDRTVVTEWTPPVQSMMASQLLEVDQLRALTKYVASVEEELARHNELRGLMGAAFSPRHPNAAKAMANWEKKSAYMLREIVKFKTYIDSLHAAQARKEEIHLEREKADAAKTDADAAPATVAEKEFKDVLARAAEELTAHTAPVAVAIEAETDDEAGGSGKITSMSPSLTSVGKPPAGAGTV